MKKVSLLLFVSAILLSGSTQQNKTMKVLSPDQKQELVSYLEAHWKSPEDYIVGKFKDYDIVFIGEAHHIKHDVELIHNIIPRLYEEGVYTIGIEFGCNEHQKKVDALLTANTYDESLASWLTFKWGSYWPYKEYIDIYKKAWELNSSLPQDKPKFRVVHLDYRANWNLVKEGMTSRQYKKVFFKGERDEHMARVILEEIVKTGSKALIYAGAHHSFTHYHQLDYDFVKRKIVKHIKNRMGNIICKKIPHKVFNIMLHYPWLTKKSRKKVNYPVGGVIDQIMREFEDKRVGFDVKDSPFGDIRDYETLYSAGYDDFSLKRICDGYVFQKHFSDYEGCTVDPLFINAENLEEAIDYLPNPRLKKRFKTPNEFLDFMRRNVRRQIIQTHTLIF